MPIKSITFFSHTYMYGNVFRVGSHHLANEFSKFGIKVEYYSTPLSPFHIILWSEKIRKNFGIYLLDVCKKNNIKEYALMNTIPYIMNMPTSYYTAYKYFDIKKFKKRFGKIETDILLIDQPRMADLIDCVDAKKIIYRPTDIYWRFHSDFSLKKIEYDLCRKVDGIISTSKPVDRYIRELCGEILNNKPTTIIQNGVDCENFLRLKELPHKIRKIKTPRALYVGSLDKRFDFKFLYEVVKKCKNIEFVIIGPGMKKDINKFRDFSNITFLGKIPYEEISAYMQHCNVGIMPLKKDELNHGRSPMKFYEYMATGLPIVSVDLEEIRNRKCPYVFFSDTVEGFSNMLIDVINKKIDKNKLISIAKDQSWRKKSIEILDFALRV